MRHLGAKVLPLALLAALLSPSAAMAEKGKQAPKATPMQRTVDKAEKAEGKAKQALKDATSARQRAEKAAAAAEGANTAHAAENAANDAEEAAYKASNAAYSASQAAREVGDAYEKVLAAEKGTTSDGSKTESSRLAELSQSATDYSIAAQEQANHAYTAAGRAWDRLAVMNAPLAYVDVAAGFAQVEGQEDLSWTARVNAGPQFRSPFVKLGLTLGILTPNSDCSPGSVKCSSLSAWDVGVMTKLSYVDESSPPDEEPSSTEPPPGFFVTVASGAWSLVRTVVTALEFTPSVGISFVDTYEVTPTACDEGDACIETSKGPRRQKLERRSDSGLALSLGVALDLPKLRLNWPLQLGVRGAVLGNPLRDEAVKVVNPFLGVSF